VCSRVGETERLVCVRSCNAQTTQLAPWSLSLPPRRLKLPKGASLHTLRHSHGSHLLASGVPRPAVSARLGHGSIRTTQEITRA
jgi:integrase